MHTVRQIRQGALWVPKVSARGGASHPEEELGVVQRAIDRAKELLRTHHVEALPDDVGRQLDEILSRARCELDGP
jgi:hypothetical protein